MSHHFKTYKSKSPHSWKRQDRTESLLRKTCAMITSQPKLDGIIAQFAAEQPPERRAAAQRELFGRMRKHLPFPAVAPAFLAETYVP